MRVTLILTGTMARELRLAAKRTECAGVEEDFSPEQFVKECVEAALAERRLQRMEMERYAG